MNLNDVLNRAKAEMDDHIKQKGRCEDAAKQLWKELLEKAKQNKTKRLAVGTGEGRNGPVIYVYGETLTDLDGLPDGYRGFAVVAKEIGHTQAL